MAFIRMVGVQGTIFETCSSYLCMKSVLATTKGRGARSYIYGRCGGFCLACFYYSYFRRPADRLSFCSDFPSAARLGPGQLPSPTLSIQDRSHVKDFPSPASSCLGCVLPDWLAVS